MNISKNKQAVMDMYELGYRVVDNVLYNPRGGQLKGSVTRPTQKVNRKTYYSHYFTHKKYPGVKIKTHLLVAYEKFGLKLLESGIHVRHLDGNSLNNNHGNIELGTARDNWMDRPTEDRRNHAIKASVNTHRLKTLEEIGQFLQDRQNGLSHTQLARKWGMHPSVPSKLLNISGYIKDAAQALGFNIEKL